jgi:hypothetical protein
MVNGSNYSALVRPVSVAPDPASDHSGADSSASGRDTPSGGDLTQMSNASDVVSLEQLVVRVEGIAIRLDALIDAVTPLIQDPVLGEDTASEESVAKGIQAATEALIYTDFFQEAAKLGMSPDMVPDAYRLADLSNVTADLETREVTGIKEAVDALLEKRPYLFFIKQNDVGLETNPIKGPSSHPEQVEGLARTLGVSPEFAAELVKKRSDKARGGSALSDIWRIPRTNRLSFLETND